IKDFYRHCTACQLCVANCPNHVLRPSMDLAHFMQPEMSFENGYCRPECTKCSQVCPAGAIKPITPQEKTQFHIGVATVDRSLCVVERDGVTCGNCARHCPVGAIMMVRKDPQDRRSPQIPSVDETKCIGCGACENLCPSRPFSAIHVNGLQVHIKD
ncbi:MAG: 4Fe-4S dicluster domain-containing protein, partial [Bacteroidales bacterium]|nr:4Fe-4S dicluster domain-containing protein [Bacteroidales bacterium]